MVLKDSNGNILQEGDVVTYSIFDENQTLADLKPFQPYLKNSRIIIGRYKDTPELRWMYGDNLQHGNIVTLTDETAKLLIVIDHDDSEV